MQNSTDKSSDVLRIKNLHVEYIQYPFDKTVKVNTDLSFEIESGQILGVVGESGAGKTTVGYAILSALKQGGRVSGGIFLYGTELSCLSEKEMKRIRGKEIGLVIQDPFSSLDPMITIREHFVESLEKLDMKLSESEIEERVYSVLRDVELPSSREFIYKYPFQLSGGQSQRVVIALALILEPKLLIADEPTTALDVFVQEQILTLIRKIVKARDMSMILISHNLGLVYQVADDIIVMKDGKIVERGSAQVVFKKPSHEYTKFLLGSLLPKDKTIDKIPSARDWDTPEDVAILEGLHLIQSKKHVTERAPAMSPAEYKNILECRGVNFFFGSPSRYKNRFMKKYLHGEDARLNEKHILHDIHLRVAHGKVLGLVGESGSGKSTIAKIITSIYARPRGIYFKGRELNKKEIVPEIQMIFQSPYSSLNPQKTIRQVFYEAIKTKHRDSDAPTLASKSRDLIQLIGLDTTSLDKKPDQFSGGQLQRICIARVLILQPELFLCDEPTSALDVSVQADILNLLKYLQTQCRMSMIFISHDLPVIRYMCDDIAVIKDGRIIEVQDRENLFNTPKEDYTKELISLIPSVG